MCTPFHERTTGGERALIVGDSSIDVATDRNAGIEVWAVPNGYNMGQTIEASAPDRIISDISLLLVNSWPN